MDPKLSCIIIAGNAQNDIIKCLETASFADEIIIVAANSSDNTIPLIKKYYPSIKIIITNDEYNKNFSKWRNLGYKAARGKWLFYLDTDERVKPALKKEILKIVNNPHIFSTYYAIPRANHFLGKRVKYGGTYPDYVKRLYLRSKFKGYQGILHEEPLIDGPIGYLKTDLLHYTHRDLSSMLQKSIAWTDTQAQALLQSGHPPVVWWRFIRMMMTKFYERLILQSMWKDGTVGWISTIFECFDTFMIYSRLWELQQKSQR